MPSPAALSIACAVNHSYLLPLAVMLSSLKHHLRPNLPLELYLIHAGIPQPDLAIISSIVETYSIALSKEELSAAPHALGYPSEAAAPLLLAELLPPSLERVLFLDADILVLQDLARLWETPLDDHVLAAVPDFALPLCSSPRGVKGWQALGIPHDAPYFNCGVLLIHLQRYREREVNRRVRKYFETTREPIDFLHQEALNAALWDDWKCLDSCWNLLASYAGRENDRTSCEGWRRPGIVHFAGRMKPWLAPIGGPFNAPYQEMLGRILPLIPKEPPALKHELYSVYDRYFRSVLYPLEQYLWRKRLI